jgi:hypothetical protein
MKLRSAILLASIVVATVAITTLVIGALGHEDDKLYNQFVTIRGSVKSIDPQTQKISIPVGQSLIFQREDCKRCLIVAVTDENGDYKLRVGRGKYRLVVRGGTKVNETVDLIAPDQLRYVNATDIVRDNIFNISLVRSSTPLDITLPALPKPSTSEP